MSKWRDCAEVPGRDVSCKWVKYYMARGWAGDKYETVKAGDPVSCKS